jgi:hypothetical protein
MSDETANNNHTIGTLNEGPLHASLKAWCAQPGDQAEMWVDGFVADLLRGTQVIEVQTASFASIRDKVRSIVADHPLRLVYPVAREKWIVKVDEDCRSQLSRRKSPKRGRVEEVFTELVSFPELLADPNFALEVLLIQEEEVRRHAPGRAWRRRGWVTHQRRLLQVVDSHLFDEPADMVQLVPGELGEPFTTADLAQAAGFGRRLAQKMAYCLRRMGALEVRGKAGRALLYVRSTG